MSKIPETINFFEIPDVVSTSISRRFEEVQPQNFDDSFDSDITFPVDASETEFTSLNFEFTMSMSLVDKKTQNPLADTFPCAPINLAPLTMFETANLYIGNKMIEGGNRLFPYKCYIAHELAYSKDAKDSWLGEAYVRARDTTGQFNTLELDKTKTRNAGFITRKDYFDNGRKVHIRVVLPFDISRSGRLIPLGIPIRIELKRAPDAFTLMADSTQGFTPAIKIENHILHVNRVKLQPTIVDSLRRKIETGATCKYVFDRMLLTHPVSVPLGSTHFTYKLTQGQTPRVILAMFVDNKGITGSYTNNCFLMDNMNVTECSAIVYGDTYPAKPYSLKFDGISGKSYNVTRMYTEFMRAMGFWQSNFGNAIKLVEYAHDNTFFCFPISHETKPTNFNVPVQKGPVTLDFTFKEPLQIEKLMITACFMQSAAYIGRGGSTWTSYILNSGLDDFEAGLA